MYFLYKSGQKLLKPVELTRRGLRKEENRVDEAIQVRTHIYMEMSQSKSLYNHHKQTKMSFFKNGEQEANGSCVGLTPERWGGYKERVKEVNVVEILGTRV
jgi:hypothetical protein